jgi:hypothetical protein
MGWLFPQSWPSDLRGVGSWHQRKRDPKANRRLQLTEVNKSCTTYTSVNLNRYVVFHDYAHVSKYFILHTSYSSFEVAALET